MLRGEEEAFSAKTDPEVKKVTGQRELDVYDTFDEYLEVILEFGYMVLFAGCIPWAPLVIIVCNLFEVRSDIFKLGSSFRRPEYWRKRNIGLWIHIMEAIGWLSIFTNLYIIMMTKADGVEIKEVIGKSGIEGFFVMEHLVVLCIVIMKVAYKPVASWVKLFKQRREYNQKNNRWRTLFA